MPRRVGKKRRTIERNLSVAPLILQRIAPHSSASASGLSSFAAKNRRFAAWQTPWLAAKRPCPSSYPLVHGRPLALGQEQFFLQRALALKLLQGVLGGQLLAFFLGVALALATLHALNHHTALECGRGSALFSFGNQLKVYAQLVLLAPL